MGVEFEPLRLAAHEIQQDVDGQWALFTAAAPDGVSIPAPYVSLVEALRSGVTLAQLSERLRSVPDIRYRFTYLGKFVGFLLDHGLLADRRAVDFAEALRADHVWRESIAFEEVYAFELLQLGGEGSRSLLGGNVVARGLVAGSLCVAAPVFLILGLLKIAELGQKWSSLSLEWANVWPCVAVFFLVFSSGRSMRSILQFVLSRLFAGGTSKLRIRVDALSISMATDEVSKSKVDICYLLSSLALLVTLVLPVFGAEFFPASGPFFGVFTLLLLISDLSPFRQSPFTDCLRAAYVLAESRGREEWMQERIRFLHVVACVIWVAFFGLYLAIPFWDFVTLIQRVQMGNSNSSAVSLAALALTQVVVLISLLDDLVSGVGDGGGSDRWSIRRLWRRRGIQALPHLLAEDRMPLRVELERLPVLRQLSPEARSLMLDHARIMEMEAGSLVCRQGDTDRALFVLLQGECAVARRSSGARRKVVALLEPGAVFGEVAFFFGEVRTADVFLTRDSRLLVIEHSDKFANLDRNRSEELQIRIWFLQALAGHATFKGLPSDALDALVFAGEKCEFRARQKIFSEGEVGDACYFIIQGQASVTQNFQTINRLKAGDGFGEIALLHSGLLRSATVVADTDLMCVRIDAQKFSELLARHLPLAIEIERLARGRLHADASRH